MKPADVREKLLSDDGALARGLIMIFECQTSDERREGETSVENGVGFNMIDAPFLTSLSKWYLENGFLTRKQLDKARRIMPKYSKQISRIMFARDMEDF
jgi:hypothetical protein